jgi:type II secretory pathway component PulC
MKKHNSIPSFFKFTICFLIGIGFNPIPDAKSKEAAFETISEVDFSYFLTNPKLPWGQDPFHKQPGFVSMPQAEENLNLSGIVYSKNIPMAVINGKIVKEGDRVNDRKVSLIGDNFVILKKKDSEIELSLPPIVDDGSENEEDGEN